MTKRDARAAGREAGFEAVINVDFDPAHDESLASAVREAEENSHQYGPFEFLAHDMNEDKDRADGLWDAYEEGIEIGIRAGMRARHRQDRIGRQEHTAPKA